VSYTRMTERERSLIYWWKQAKKGVREIATLLRRAPSSVSREVRRNTGERGYRQPLHIFTPPCQKGYRPLTHPPLMAAYSLPCHAVAAIFKRGTQHRSSVHLYNLLTRFTP